MQYDVNFVKARTKDILWYTMSLGYLHMQTNATLVYCTAWRVIETEMAGDPLL